jgi:ankyrin repeat protein
LILEKLPKSADRDTYMDQRRAERGRPALHRGYRNQYKMGGNIKDQEEDEVAEWIEQEEVASYHTMTVPYGPKYQAARINRLLYAKDLLLNAEWNKPDDREVHLHRHPCFFGTAEEVLEDCCGYCPAPKTDEEHEVAEEESKTYISGRLTFLKDDPGRQEIGSFNPITDDEWTTMAYVGDTARLCQAIVDGDLEHVQDWCEQEGVDVNRRDYTGRTPLHLATMASTPEIVNCLIDHGARMIARLVDGRTALHIAAARGNAEMVKALMDKSLANEEEEEEKEEARRAAKRAEHAAKGNPSDHQNGDSDGERDDESEASEITLESEEENDAMTMGSFVKVESGKQAADEGVPEDSEDDPDVYEVDVIAWDYGLSPLHLAILNGHLEIVDLLVSEYGADVLLPVKLVHPGTNTARGAIMTIVLAMSLEKEKAKEMVKLLLQLGATSAQADMNHYTALHYVVNQDHHDVLDVLLSNDRPVALSVLNNVGSTQHFGNQCNTPLASAIEQEYTDMAAKLLKLGAKPTIEFDDWVKMYLAKNVWAKQHNSDQTMSQYHDSVTQPIVAAATKEMGKAVEDLIAHGADPCALEKSAYSKYQPALSVC